MTKVRFSKTQRIFVIVYLLNLDLMTSVGKELCQLYLILEISPFESQTFKSQLASPYSEL